MKDLTMEDQMFIFLNDLLISIEDATYFANEDPERSRRVLRAIASDIKTLRSFLTDFLLPSQ